jgi:hypothetical protein
MENELQLEVLTPYYKATCATSLTVLQQGIDSLEQQQFVQQLAQGIGVKAARRLCRMIEKKL